MTTNENIPEWLKELEEEDYNFIKRFILNSGSLKAMAIEYDISYPTMRIRLDKLIDKILLVNNPTEVDAFRRKIKMMIINGELHAITGKKILNEYKKAIKEG